MVIRCNKTAISHTLLFQVPLKDNRNIILFKYEINTIECGTEINVRYVKYFSLVVNDKKFSVFVMYGC